MSDNVVEAARVPPSHARMSPWRMWRTALVVCRLELEQMRRCLLLPWLLAGWAVICLAALIPALAAEGDIPRGPWVFSVLAYAALTASIATGSVCAVLGAFRERNTDGLTVLRSTNTVGFSLVVGKLLAAACMAIAWSLVPLVLSVVTLFMGVSPLRLGGLLIVCALFGVTSSALGLGLAQSFSSPRSSAAVALAVITLLNLGTLAAYRATMPLVTSPQRLESYWQIGPQQPCVLRLITEQVQATNDNWWLMLPSPYVAAADILSGQREAAASGAGQDLLLRTQQNVREARTGPSHVIDNCNDGLIQAKTVIKAPNWPYTVLINAGLALLGVFLSVRAFSTPRTGPGQSRCARSADAG